MQYKLTALVGIYKASKFIESKIASLLSQTIFKDIQIILLNCQNLENESDYYQEFLQHNNVKEIKYDQHVKLYKTWNDGINTFCKSEYLTNANVDDQWHPQFAEKCCNYLDINYDVSVVSTNILVTEIPNQLWPNWQYTSIFPKYTYPGSTAGPCPVWRTILHNKYGLFDDYTVISDALAWEKWLQAGEKFDRIDEDLVLYYRNPESLERRHDETTGKSLLEIDLHNKYPHLNPNNISNTTESIESEPGIQSTCE